MVLKALLAQQALLESTEQMECKAQRVILVQQDQQAQPDRLAPEATHSL